MLLRCELRRRRPQTGFPETDCAQSRPELMRRAQGRLWATMQREMRRKERRLATRSQQSGTREEAFFEPSLGATQ